MVLTAFSKIFYFSGNIEPIIGLFSSILAFLYALNSIFSRNDAMSIILALSKCSVLFSFKVFNPASNQVSLVLKFRLETKFDAEYACAGLVKIIATANKVDPQKFENIGYTGPDFNIRCAAKGVSAVGAFGCSR